MTSSDGVVVAGLVVSSSPPSIVVNKLEVAAVFVLVRVVPVRVIVEGVADSATDNDNSRLLWPWGDTNKEDVDDDDTTGAGSTVAVAAAAAMDVEEDSDN
jgi:hypothetical protein